MLTSIQAVASCPGGSTISLSGRMRQAGTVTSLEDKKQLCLRLMVDGVPHGFVLDLLGGTWTDESMMAAAIRRAPTVLLFEVEDAAYNRSCSVGSLSIAHFVRWDHRHFKEKRP